MTGSDHSGHDLRVRDDLRGRIEDVFDQAEAWGRLAKMR